MLISPSTPFTALYNCLPLTASVDFAEYSPSPTLVSLLFTVSEPIETSLEVEATEPLPIATELDTPDLNVISLPKAKLLFPITLLLLPMA